MEYHKEKKAVLSKFAEAASLIGHCGEGSLEDVNRTIKSLHGHLKGNIKVLLKGSGECRRGGSREVHISNMGPYLGTLWDRVGPCWVGQVVGALEYGSALAGFRHVALDGDTIKMTTVKSSVEVGWSSVGWDLWWLLVKSKRLSLESC